MTVCGGDGEREREMAVSVPSWSCIFCRERDIYIDLAYICICP